MSSQYKGGGRALQRASGDVAKSLPMCPSAQRQIDSSSARFGSPTCRLCRIVRMDPKLQVMRWHLTRVSACSTAFFPPASVATLPSSAPRRHVQCELAGGLDVDIAADANRDHPGATE